tara:strand:- start:91 stop:969 length:879 start_codon:yes stop_codon:yes gene_type:complete
MKILSPDQIKKVAERYNRSHLSASALNLFASSVPLYFVQYHMGVYGPTNLAMIAGNVSERAVEYGIKNPEASMEKCRDVAVKGWQEETRQNPFNDKKKNLGTQEKQQAKLDDVIGYGSVRKSYPGMVASAITELRKYGIPDDAQVKIETYLDGIPIPIIGFKDFSYDEHGIDIDLKTTGRMPVDMSADHQLQGAIYRKASGNRAQRFCYTTKSEAKVLELEADAANRAIGRATMIAHTIFRLLSISEDIEEIYGLMIPDYSNFRWSEPTRAKAEQVWSATSQANENEVTVVA